MIRDFGIQISAHDAQGIHFAEEVIDILADEFSGFDAVLKSARDDFIVDIRKVLYAAHFIAVGFQHAAYDIEHHVAAGMTDMAHVVWRDAAHIHAHVVGFGGLKLFNTRGQGVMQTNHLVSRSTTAWAGMASPRPIASNPSLVFPLI